MSEWGGSPQGWRIGYVSSVPLDDRRGGSGGPFRMARELEGRFGPLADCTVERPAAPLRFRAWWKLQRIVLGRRVRWHNTARFCRTAARLTEGRLAAARPDVIFCAVAAWVLAAARHDIPIVNCTDSTFLASSRLGWYPAFEGLSRRARDEAVSIERDFLRRVDVHVVASRWAAASMREDYGVEPERIVIAPWAANLEPEEAPPREEAVTGGRGSGLRLLFLATTWERKGGDIALETLVELERAGVKAELVVCGCEPPRGIAHPRMRVTGFLSKNDPSQRARLAELLRSSSFLLLPTRAETYGYILCEAAAMGMPAVTSAVGATPEIVEHGVTGFVLPLVARGGAYAAAIADVWADPEHYSRLRHGSRDAYERRLNWGHWGDVVARALDTIGFRGCPAEGRPSPAEPRRPTPAVRLTGP